MAISLRLARGNDFTRIRTLFTECDLAGSWFNKPAYLRMLRRNSGFYWVAQDAQVVVGSVFGSHDGAHHGYIYKLAVTEKYRGRQVASRLLRKLVSCFLQEGIVWQFALTEKNNKNVARLFRQAGFDILGDYLLASMSKKKPISSRLRAGRG